MGKSGHGGYDALTFLILGIAAGAVILVAGFSMGVSVEGQDASTAVEPPAGGEDGATSDLDAPGLLALKKSPFSIPTTIRQATLVRNAAGGGIVTVTVSADPDEKVVANLPDAAPVALFQIPGRPGTYTVSLRFTPGERCTPVTVTNRSDTPPVSLVRQPVDVVIISTAAFDRESRTLVIRSHSTDRLPPGPVLQVFDEKESLLGTIVGEQLFVRDLMTIPARICVRSSRGGSALRRVVKQ